MNESTAIFVVVIVAIAIWLLVGKVIINYFHNINNRERLMKAQTAFLEKLCLKMGVPQNEIDEINKHCEYKKIKL